MYDFLVDIEKLIRSPAPMLLTLWVCIWLYIRLPPPIAEPNELLDIKCKSPADRRISQAPDIKR